jgi:hypothetical protein
VTGDPKAEEKSRREKQKRKAEEKSRREKQKRKAEEKSRSPSTGGQAHTARTIGERVRDDSAELES